MEEVRTETENASATEAPLAPPPLSAAASDAPLDSKLVGVKGWLLVFVLMLVVISPLLSVVVLGLAGLGIAAMAAGVAPNGAQLATMDVVGFVLTTAVSLGALAFGVYTGIRLWRVAPGAVRLARLYLAVYAGATALNVLIDAVTSMMSGRGLSGVGTGIAGAMVFVGGWMWYLQKSKRVRATYGENAGTGPIWKDAPVPSES